MLNIFHSVSNALSFPLAIISEFKKLLLVESEILGFGFQNASSTDEAFEYPVPGVGNPQREIHLAVQYLLRIVCLYSVTRLVGVGLVRNSNKVKWKRLMFQKQYPVDLVIKYI